MKKLLPQANTLSTVIKTFIYVSNKDNCTLQDVANFCKFDVRQASYYCNACYYLGLLDENLHVTELGNSILQNNHEITVRIYNLVISNSLISKIFAKLILFNKGFATKYAINVVTNEYPEYSEAVVNRRAKCLVGWCEEIFEYINKREWDCKLNCVK